MFCTKTIRLVTLGMLTSVGLGCHGSAEPGEGASAKIPSGQVWLTPAQVRDAKIAVETVDIRTVEDTILTSGRISLDDQRSGHVFSPVTGRVLSINAQLGERVKKGQPLAVIESPDIGNVVSDVHKAQADLIAAEHDRKRKKDLFEAKAASAADVEQSEDAYRKAKTELERARAKEYLLRVGNVDAVTQTYTLSSPIEGEVLLRNINPGIEVQGQYGGGTAAELFTIGEVDKVWLLGDVYEMDLARVHVGTPVRVTVVAYPGEDFKGQVDWVSGMLDPSSRTTKLRCTFENPKRKLRPEMYATMEITVDEKKALAVPRNAILRIGDANIVFVQIGEADGRVKFERTPVQVDEGESSPYIEVKGGLEKGQTVVTNGAILLASKP